MLYRLVLTVASAIISGLVIRDLVRHRSDREPIATAPAKAAWLTALALLGAGVYCLARGTSSPSETLDPGAAGYGLMALLLLLLVLAVRRPTRAAQALRAGAATITACSVAVGVLLFSLDRQAFDR